MHTSKGKYQDIASYFCGKIAQAASKVSQAEIPNPKEKKRKAKEATDIDKDPLQEKTTLPSEKKQKTSHTPSKPEKEIHNSQKEPEQMKQMNLSKKETKINLKISTLNLSKSGAKKKIINDDDDDDDNNVMIETKQDKKIEDEKNYHEIDPEELEIINQQILEMEEEEARKSKVEKEKEKESSSTPTKTPLTKKAKQKISSSSQTKSRKKSNKKTKSNAEDEDVIMSEELEEETNKKPRRKSAAIDPEVSGPLTGLTFVLTGQFPIDRDNLSSILKGYGAKATGSVSKKTSYLLYGSKLEDGREVTEGNKYKKALALNTKMMNQQEFEIFMREKLGIDDWEMSTAEYGGAPQEVNLGKVNETAATSETSAKKSYLKPHAKNTSDIISPNNAASPKHQPITTMGKGYSKSPPPVAQLWSTKYHPKNLSEIVGNQKIINKFIEWLDSWEDVVIKGNKKELKDSYRGGGRMENPNAKACLISGDPGIGKTTSVRLIASLKGYKTYELNASDQRNKAIISSKLGFLFDNTTLYGGDIQDKNLIIMDEVDGMGGNEDRGGIAALIEVIKKTKTPIVCIANDRQCIKLKSLANYCYDLKFSKPDKRLIVNRLLEICKAEKIQAEPNALEYLCESTSNDIRQCLNFLEMWSRKYIDLKYFDMKKLYTSFNKDSITMISNFEAATRLLNKAQMKKMHFRDKMDLFFIDYDLIPLLVHENYISCYNSSNNSDISSLVRSTEHISVGDLLNKRVRSHQDWTLLADQGIHSCIAVGTFSGGFINFPKFPVIMGKFSSINKSKRQLRELKYCFPGQSFRSLKDEISALVLSKIANTLADFGKDGIDACLQLFKEYKITMELFRENILDLQPNESILNKYEKINSTIRAAFTKAYNEIFQRSIERKKKTISSEDVEKLDMEGNPIEGRNNEKEGEVEKEQEQEQEQENIEGEVAVKIKTRKASKKPAAQKTKKK